jgi:hypothetical protein
MQQLTPSIALEWSEDKRFAIYTIRTVAPNELQVWADSVKQIMTEWPQGKAIGIIQDINYPKMALTPTLRAHVSEFGKLRPDIIAYVGVVLPKTFATQMMSIFTRVMQKKNQPARVCFTREEAVEWIRTSLQKHELVK